MKKFCFILTDFGNEDNFAAVMKGVILKICPDCRIIDITNTIAQGDIKRASFALESAFNYMPNGVYLCVVDPGVGTSRKAIIVKYKSSYFIGPDNGIFTFFIQNGGNVYEIKKHKYIKDVSNTFHGRDIFAPTAGGLLKGLKLTKLAKKLNKSDVPITPDFPLPYIGKSSIKGVIKYIDSFGNLITNIRAKKLDISGNPLIRAEINGMKNIQFYNAYSDATNSTPSLTAGSSGYIEVFVKNASAEKILYAKEGDYITLHLGNNN
jgi:S-adenosylmethionine hydrolase